MLILKCFFFFFLKGPARKNLIIYIIYFVPLKNELEYIFFFLSKLIFGKSLSNKENLWLEYLIFKKLYIYKLHSQKKIKIFLFSKCTFDKQCLIDIILNKSNLKKREHLYVSIKSNFLYLKRLFHS